MVLTWRRECSDAAWSGENGDDDDDDDDDDEDAAGGDANIDGNEGLLPRAARCAAELRRAVRRSSSAACRLAMVWVG